MFPMQYRGFLSTIDIELLFAIFEYAQMNDLDEIIKFSGMRKKNFYRQINSGLTRNFPR